MTTRTKDAAVLAIVMIAGLAFLIGDLHRTILRAVWPYVTAFFDYLAA